MTFVGEVCQYLLKETIEAPLRSKALVPTFIQNVRFRKFVEPGDQAIMKADVIEGDLTKDGSDILVRAQIYANDNRVMQAEMGFRTMFAESHAQKLAAKYESEGVIAEGAKDLIVPSTELIAELGAS